MVHVVVGGEHGVDHRHVDPGSHSGSLDHAKRAEDRDERVETGVVIRTREHRISRRHPVEERLTAHDPAFGLDDRGVCGSVRVGTLCAEAADRTHHEPAIDRGQHGPVEAQSGHHASPEVLDHDVGAGRESDNHRRRALRAQVDADIALAGVLLLEEAADAVALLPPDP